MVRPQTRAHAAKTPRQPRVLTALAVVLAAAWLASGWFSAGYTTAGHRVIVLTGGRVRAILGDVREMGVFPQPGSYLGRPLDLRDARWRFNIELVPWPPGFGQFGTVEFPLWIPFVPIAALAAWRRRRWALWRRRALAGNCRKCGYDLAGLGKGTSCPECGRA